MKQRPILFNGEMVRAILAGRKTQTRRIVKGLALEWLGPDMFTPDFAAHPENHLCLHGQVGDRLWVRETHSLQHGYSSDFSGQSVWYWADGNHQYGDWSKPRPSIHMPRWASRITLEITKVRVERLNSISEGDAIAEGFDNLINYPPPCGYTHRGAFANTWDAIYTNWSNNPWVWVIEFKRLDSLT